MPWQKDGQKDWRTEEWTDPILYDPSGYKLGVQKVKIFIILVIITSIFPVFSIWKSMLVLQKACTMIVAHVIYTYIYFSYTYTLFVCWEIKCYCHRWFPQQIRPKITAQSYISWGYSSVRIGFNMINNHYTLPIV